MDRNKIFLAQTDTTVGFLSCDSEQLSKVKKRASSQKILEVVSDFTTLLANTRIPKGFKRIVRRAKRTTFIYPNGLSFRYISPNYPHHHFVKRFKKIYSTSANETGKRFSYQFAYDVSDIIIYSKCTFVETSGSAIYKLTPHKRRRVR